MACFESVRDAIREFSMMTSHVILEVEYRHGHVVRATARLYALFESPAGVLEIVLVISLYGVWNSKMQHGNGNFSIVIVKITGSSRL